MECGASDYGQDLDRYRYRLMKQLVGEMPRWQGGTRCVMMQRLSCSGAVLKKAAARHGVIAERQGAFTSCSRDATAVASSRRVKVNRWVRPPHAAKAPRR